MSEEKEELISIKDRCKRKLGNPSKCDSGELEKGAWPRGGRREEDTMIETEK